MRSLNSSSIIFFLSLFTARRQMTTSGGSYSTPIPHASTTTMPPVNRRSGTAHKTVISSPLPSYRSVWAGIRECPSPNLCDGLTAPKTVISSPLTSYRSILVSINGISIQSLKEGYRRNAIWLEFYNGWMVVVLRHIQQYFIYILEVTGHTFPYSKVRPSAGTNTMGN